MTQLTDKTWADGAKRTVVDGQYVYTDKDGEPVQPRPSAWTPPKPKVDKRNPDVVANRLIPLGPDWSSTHYRLFQNERGVFERWNLIQSDARPAGRTMSTRSSTIWYVYVCDLD